MEAAEQIRATPGRFMPLLLAVAAVLAVVGPGAAAAELEKVDLKKWPEGPIRYIAERDEVKVFKRLATDADRALFIERFWARRDPSPETLTNEYRQLFWERVQQANDNFLDSSRPGWKTDRGKIHILYGPPQKIEEDINLQTQGLPAAGRGLVRWIYEGRPEGRMDLNPVVIVPFVRDTGGEYRVSYDPRLSSVFFDARAYEEGDYRAMDRFLEMYGAPRKTDLSVMLDLGKMQEVPPQAQVLLERVETVESYHTQPLELAVQRYRHPEKSGVLAVITVDVTHIPAPTLPSVIARFNSHDATESPRMLGEDSFRVWDADNGRRFAQGRLVLDAGEYDLTVFVAGTESSVTGMSRSVLRLPAPNPQLTFSDVVLASALDPLEYASLASHDEPYHVGPFEVLPKIGDAVLRGESVRVFFEIYGGDAPYDVSYRVEGLDDDGSWVALGRPATTEQQLPSQAWELPTSERWPLGEYRITIDVLDARERLISRQVPFRLVETEDTPAEGEASVDVAPASR